MYLNVCVTRLCLCQAVSAEGKAGSLLGGSTVSGYNPLDGRDPNNPEFIYKKWCVCSYMCKLSHLPRAPPVLQRHRAVFPWFGTVSELAGLDAF